MNTETIKNRKSVRTYEEQQIPEQTMRQIREFLNQDDNPFGVPITFSILDADKDGVSSPVILGAHTYVVSAQQSLSQNHEQLWIPAERGYAASNSMKWMESDPLSLSAK